MTTNKYDSEFETIHTLTWIPWVGTNYDFEPEAQFLIVGESHYAQDNQGRFSEKHYNQMLSNRNETRKVVKLAIAADGGWKFFKNASKAIMGTSRSDISLLWSNVAFMNFIQKPMKTNSGRPSSQDYRDGWENFIEVIQVLKPTHCIFFGSSSAIHLSKEIQKHQKLSCEITLNHKKIGLYYGKKAVITVNNYKTSITFVKHPSSFFKWELWYDYLNSRNGSAIVNLRNRILNKI
jgi:hypothetical protein